MTQSSEQKQRINAEAREWLIYLHSGTVDEAGRARFKHWITANKAHAQEYRQVEQFWRDLAMVQALAPEQAAANAAPNTAPRGQQALLADSSLGARLKALWAWPTARPLYLGLGSAAVIALVLAVGVLFNTPSGGLAVQPSRYATAVGEQRDIVLADGSQLVLGGRSSLTVALSNKQRLVTLTEGQVFLQVAKEAERPFIVVSPQLRVRVTGTAFDIATGGRTRVAVLEGVVEVSPAGSGKAGATVVEKTLVRAGQQVTATADGRLPVPQPIRGGAPGAWREGRFSYADARLAEVVSDANRYYAPGIILADEALKERRVNTAFRTGQIEQMFRALAVSQGIHLQKTANGQIILQLSRTGQ